MVADSIVAGTRARTGEDPISSVGLQELDPTELEAVEGGLLFLAGALVGLGTGVLVGIAIFR
jgi:hypothetical protein